MSIKEILLYDFRRLQAASLRLSDDDVRAYHSASKELDEWLRKSISGVLGRWLDCSYDGDCSSIQLLKHPKKRILCPYWSNYNKMIDMNKLSFSIIQTNEGPTVVTLIDGVELLHKDWNIGLSVCDFFHTTNLMHAGKSVLGICSCGCEGCDDYTIDIKIQGNEVTWERCGIRTDDEQERKSVSYHFNKAEYMSAINVFMRECSDYLDRENKGSIDYTFNRLRLDLEGDLRNFYPPIRDDTRASSSNLIARFVMNYKCFASYNSKMVNWWTQIPIRIRERKEYIEGLIIDKARKTLYFIETRKECEHPKSYMDFNSMIEDVRDIIYPGSGDFFGLNLYEYDSYIVYLTDEMYVIQRMFSSFEYKSRLSSVQLNERDKLSPQAYLAYADDIGFEAALALANSVI